MRGQMGMGQAWHSSWRDAKGQSCIASGLGVWGAESVAVLLRGPFHVDLVQ